MKKDLHPKYNPVIFQDMSTGKQFITRSSAKSERTEEVDGVDHYVISIGVTSDSHPFFTGKTQFVDTEGRIDKFQKRFGAIQRRKKPTRGGTAEAEAPKAAEAPKEADAPKAAEAPKEADAPKEG